jgi:hypothetical protein
MRLSRYLTEIKIGKTEINYSPTPDSELGIYIRTIGTSEKFQNQGYATNAILKLIDKYPQNKKITFSTPLSKGGKALTQALLKKGIFSPYTDKWGTHNHQFLITKRLTSYEKKHGLSKPNPFLS